ncbi:transposase, IS605 OrfB family [Polaromonas naphthalenivorans CJ2]|uniref:Transposase, IS605 OrfB family n=1 Tax=Polaromonas naphthalenivorans (strain CJ2) TaxID=365044 RepID=A1VIC7_POLNA|nr:transposase, IS605 OrfB family [Polaromonas naphthalenivorans CJ2]
MPAAGLEPSLAIDVGLTVFAATSAGVKIKPLLALKRQARYVRRAQKSVSRKVKGSANRKKAICKLGDLHRRIARQREDWLHKLTTELADRHPVIAIEDLRIKNMSASAKGTKDAPGKNIRQKAGLNRLILDAAWGEFGRQLQYKLQWRGGQLVLVEPAYSSQTCAACDHVAAENRKSQAFSAWPVATLKTPTSTPHRCSCSERRNNGPRGTRHRLENLLQPRPVERWSDVGQRASAPMQPL